MAGIAQTQFGEEKKKKVSAGMTQREDVLARLRERSRLGLPGHMQVEPMQVDEGFIVLRLTIQPFHLAPNGYLHAATVVALADTACGFGCISNLPSEAINFTTVELKTNFLRTATDGTIVCEAALIHGGRRTQIWDATVYDEQRRAMALFRCTQMLLYA